MFDQSIVLIGGGGKDADIFTNGRSKTGGDVNCMTYRHQLKNQKICCWPALASPGYVVIQYNSVVGEGIGILTLFMFSK